MDDVKVQFYLSCIRITTEVKRTYLRYYLHKMIWQAFERKHGATQPFLFYVNKVTRDYIEFYVQSLLRPCWEECNEFEVFGMKEVKFMLTKGDIFSYRLLGSPVKNIMQPKGTRGKKRAMTKIAEVERWFERRADEKGFILAQKNINSDIVKTRTSSEVGADSFALAVCDFAGVLQVADPKKMVSAIEQGVGPKKAFGFGMLQLGRVS